MVRCSTAPHLKLRSLLISGKSANTGRRKGSLAVRSIDLGLQFTETIGLLQNNLLHFVNIAAEGKCSYGLVVDFGRYKSATIPFRKINKLKAIARRFNITRGAVIVYNLRQLALLQEFFLSCELGDKWRTIALLPSNVNWFMSLSNWIIDGDEPEITLENIEIEPSLREWVQLLLLSR